MNLGSDSAWACLLKLQIMKTNVATVGAATEDVGVTNTRGVILMNEIDQ